MYLTQKDFDEQIEKFMADGWGPIRKGIASSRKLFMGDVFTSGQKDWHESRNKPALTYNMALAHFKQHAGAQRQAKIVEKVYALKDGTIPVAAALTKILNTYSNHGHLQHVHNRIADDTWVGGLGVSETYFNTLTEDPFGEVNTVSGNPLLHMFDLSALAPDGGDIMDAIKESWLDRRALARALPDIERLDPAMLNAAVREGRGGSSRRTNSRDPIALLKGVAETGHHEFTVEEITGIDYQNSAHFVEWYRRKVEDRVKLHVIETGMTVDVTELTASDAGQLARGLAGQGLSPIIIRKPMLQLYLSILLGRDVIVDDLQVKPNVLPWTYSFGYRLGHILLGEGVSLIDPSRGFSKVMSSFTEQIAKEANKGLITIGALDDEADVGTIEALKDIANGLGGHANLSAGSSMQVVDYHASNAGNVNYANQMLEVMKIIAASPDNSRGVGEGSHQSGVHAQQMIAQSMIGGEYLRDNLLLARKVLANTVIKFIQHYDGEIPYRIFNYIDDETGEPDQVQFNQGMADQITNDLKMGSYDTTVDFQAYSVTDRQGRAKAVIDAIQASGQPVPVEMMIKLAELSDADALVQMYYKAQAAQQQQALLQAIANPAGSR